MSVTCPHDCGNFHVTLDLDEVKKPPETLKNGKLHVPCVHWRVSAGGNGVHVLACVLEDPELTVFDFVSWRGINKDDKGRLEFDRQRWQETLDKRWITGNLWESKNGKNAGEWQTWTPSKPGRTRVVNISITKNYDVYIGRGVGRLNLERSIWCNPFKITDSESRAEVIERFREYIKARPDLLARIGELKGKVLGCWCAPEPCHGDVLIELAEGGTFE